MESVQTYVQVWGNFQKKSGIGSLIQYLGV